MKIKKGDTVKVISGGEKVKGLSGKIISINAKTGRVVLEGGPNNKRHLKPERSRKYPEGGIIEKPASIHISNVMLVSPTHDRPVRVGFEFKDGQKVRITRGKNTSGAVL